MPSQYVLASQVSPIHTRRAIRVRLVRSYEVPALRGQAISKSKECLFHDEEGTYIHGTISREDVVKVVEIHSPVEKLIAGKPSRLMDFLIEDTEERQLKCTIWDDHVDAMLPYFNSTEPEPVIVLIQLCRAKTVNGEVRITNSYDATKLWFNHYCREFTEFKAKLTKENTPMKSISTNSMVSQTTDLRDFISGSVVITTISDLYQQTESGDFYVPAMITGIESSGEWYYISCKSTGCNKKLKFKNGLLYCEKCDRKWQNGTVRYKLVVRVADAGSDAPFLLWDRECSELLGMTGDSLYSRSVKVNIKKDYKQNCGSAFGVMNILNDENIVAAYCSSFGVDQEKDLISKMLEDYGNEYSEDDESGGDEVNSPNNIIKPRQQEVQQEMNPLSKRSLLDQFSSTQQMKKGRLEVIKKEKIV
ncbi:replication protein A 70 kDa DNA-binding subunit B-like [Ipomoea triloba]|uniref:replication protein A 70 kDa DNA-binding subunit B-like n=1 Tax=Ipomoea triloba TaxID=35885 RepID=UPI00125D7A12|nr:replication protein A 70 kDa DNA-binding subunit B-like [Ipomoea triloba]